MQLADILPLFDEIAPLRYAASWDNVGLLAGDPAQSVTDALLTIDYTPAVAREAQALGCQLVYAYHPPLFEAVKALCAPHPVFAAIRLGIALYSPHTALDVAPGGVNDMLADILQLQDRMPLRLSAPPHAGLGIGRIGRLSHIPAVQLLQTLKQGLALTHLLVCGPTTKTVARAAVLAGAGGEFIEDALAQHADLFVTGEIRHHDALRAAAQGMLVVAALHSNSERPILRPLAQRLKERLPALRTHISRVDADPLQIY